MTLHILGGWASAAPLAVTPADVAPLIFGCLIFVFPIAVYCLFLAMINGRARPTLISGPWDFVGVLLALSGFLLVGGPTILGALHSRWRAQMVQGQLPALRWIGAESSTFWLILWTAYFLIVVGGAFIVLRRRRSVTVIYNVEPRLLDELVPQVLSQLKLEGSRTANRFFVSRTVRENEPTQAIQVKSVFSEGSASLAKEPRIGYLGENGVVETVGRATLEMDPFVAMHHVTLRWDGDDSIRRDVEAELGRQFSEVVTPDNPAAGWLLTVATCLFGALLVGLIVTVLLLVRR